jgi:Kef-type K+ transport system membrane component KefB/nucleotide-binding universal stress UspA family protein
MQSLSETDLLTALLALAVILVLARAMAEIARRVGQPEVLGELFAGFLLGPSVFGAFAPSLYHTILEKPTVDMVLSGFSWIGVILLLLMAGLEVDLNLLRGLARPGVFTAVFAIVPSLVAGTIFAALVLHHVPPSGFFLGIVLSVTGVSVAAKILMERGEMRREYAQIIVAAGVASEVLVWLFVAVVSSLHGSSPVIAGLLHTLYALLVFLAAMTVGRRFVFWTMRRVRDRTGIVRGQVTLVLVFAFIAAAITQALGLHALLGPFVVGVLLGRAPRTNERLIGGLQTLTVAVFGPVFFALAGMRVDILQLGSVSAVATVLLLLLVATVVKVGMGALGARLGGTRPWEAAIVGAGANLKGGTDVVVAVVGTTLGLLSATAYTMYAVVAIITVLFSPGLIGILARRAPPTEAEHQRLEAEEAQSRSYMPRIERVLVPISKQLRGSLAASVVQSIATAKHLQGQIFDITEVEVRQPSQGRSAKVQEARDRIGEAGALKTVEVTERSVDPADAVSRILQASQNYDLIAIGAAPPRGKGALSLGTIQDRIIDEADADVLVAIDDKSDHFDCSTLRHILVPTNGLEYSMAAGDIAASLADSCDARVTLMHVVHPVPEAKSSRGAATRETVTRSGAVLDELLFRIRRLNVEVDTCTAVSQDAGQAIIDELGKGSYDLVVMGGIDRGRDGSLYLGHSIQTVLLTGKTPAVLLVTHETLAAE